MNLVIIRENEEDLYAVIERLGEEPRKLPAPRFREGGVKIRPVSSRPPTKELVGVDVFIDWTGEGRPTSIGHGLEAAAPEAWTLMMIPNRGDAGYDVIKTEHLYTFDGERGYSLGQGE